MKNVLIYNPANPSYYKISAAVARYVKSMTQQNDKMHLLHIDLSTEYEICRERGEF